MAGHYPFSGKANRVSVFAFYEKHGLSLDLQEKYYRWWFELAKNYVEQDADLKFTRGHDFVHFPYGQHALHDFHLHKYLWCTTMIDLGEFIKSIIMPKMSEAQLKILEHDHNEMLKKLEEEAKTAPRQPVPEIGYFRHT